MSKYHEVKQKLRISPVEEKEHNKCAITKMIESYYEKGEKLPKIVLDSIDFTNGVFSEYYMVSDNNQMNIKNKETIAQNIMRSLPLEMYEDYMDTSWLKTYEDETSKLMYSLIYSEKFDVINKFLELISQEKATDNFNNEIFEPIFHLDHNMFNLFNKNNYHNESENNDTANNKSIVNYLNIFYKALETWKPFYKQACQAYKSEIKDVKKWHKEYEYLYVLNGKSKLHSINIYLLKNDSFLEVIKDIFNQYDKPQENLYLSKDYLEEAVKNGQEKIVTYYIAELLKNNEMTQEGIEKSIVKAFNEKISEMTSYINGSFGSEYKNNYENTYQLKEIYDIVIKYGNYKPNYKMLSNMLLIDNKEFQKSFVQKIIPPEKVCLNNMNIKQWKQVGTIIEQIKEINGTGFKESFKQNKGSLKEKQKEFVARNPYECVYSVNQINTLYSGKEEPLSEKELDEVYKYMKNEINDKMINPMIDLDKLRLNNKLNKNLEEKGKTKTLKI